MKETLAMTSIYEFECYGKPNHIDMEDWLDMSIDDRISQGIHKWSDTNKNTVVNVGLDDVLDKYFKGSTYTAAHYVGITAGSPTPAAGDTMASHGGWTEVTAYDESVRQTLTLGTVSSQSVDNSASKATFTISTVSPDSTTCGGAFLTTNSTKGGTSGTLYGIAAFSAGDKVLSGGDTLQVTVTLTAASA